MQYSHMKHVTRLGRTVIVLALASITGCDLLTAPADSGAVEIAVQDGQLALVNHTTAPTFIQVESQRTAASVDWVPCVDALHCSPLAAGATRLVPVPSNPDGSPAQAVIVNWWHVVDWPVDALRPDSVRSVVIPL